MYIELSDKQWEAILDYLPPVDMSGRPRCEERSVINWILFVLGPIQKDQNLEFGGELD